jgi:hypothetical protein
MIKFGKVTDLNTGTGIPYASVEVFDKNGTYLGAGVSADVSGNFNIDTLQLKPGTFIKISSVGFQSGSYSFDQFVNLDVFSLQRLTENLPDYVVTAKRSIDNQQKMLIIGGLGLLALILLTNKKII